MGEYILERIRDCAKLTPDRQALVCQDQHITYRQLYDLSSRIANGLLQQGLKPGTRIAVLNVNAPSFWRLAGRRP